jgi:hypothetical protein
MGHFGVKATLKMSIASFYNVFLIILEKKDRKKLKENFWIFSTHFWEFGQKMDIFGYRHVQYPISRQPIRINHSNMFGGKLLP